MNHRPLVWPWVVAGGSMLAFFLSMAAGPPGDGTFEDLLTVPIFGSVIAALAFVGALLASRVPRNSIGYLLLGAGALMSGAISAGQYAALGAISSPDPLPGTTAAAVLNQVLFLYPLVIALIAVPLVFPDGRLPGRRWRWIAWLTVAAMGASTIGDLLDTKPLVGGIISPFGSPSLAPVVAALGTFASVTSIAGFGSAAAAVLVRFRRARGVERQQLKWLMAVAGFAAVVVPASLLAPTEDLANAIFVLDLAAFIALPISIGVAILRYRLYDIDRIISRTIGWGLVTGILVAVFAAAVLGLQAALAGVTQGQTLAVAASTLVAFALFAPLRRRVQRAVDRRFDRARYDGQRVVDAFAERLRDRVDLAEVETDITGTVREALRPGSVTVWVRRGVEG